MGFKSDLNLYYTESYNELRNVTVPCECINCQPNCTNPNHTVLINVFYDAVVQALHTAAVKTVNRTPSNALKAFWNDELERLKHGSIFWHSLWENAGRPATGTLHHIKYSVKANRKPL